MNKRFTSLIVFILIAFQQFLHAGIDNLKIEDFSYKDGLTSSGLNRVFKDSQGFIWLCSNNGLFRFDGYTFRNLNSLTNTRFNRETLCVTEDSAHNLLIGAENGIFYFNTLTYELETLNFDFPGNYKVQKLSIIHNQLFAATTQGLAVIPWGVNTFNGEKVTIKILQPDSLHLRTPQDNLINDLYFAADPTILWVATNGALYQFNIKNQKFTLINSFNQNSIRGLTRYYHKILASSWDGGIFVLNPQTKLLDNDYFINQVNTIIGDKRVMSAYFDPKGKLWIATFGSGLYLFENDSNGKLIFDNLRNNQQQGGIRSDFINEIYADNEGVLWLSMNQPALTKIYNQTSRLKYIKIPQLAQKQASKEIMAISASVSPNKFWVTTNGSGIYLYDFQKVTFEQFSHSQNSKLQLQNNEVTTCYQDRSGNLWIVYRKIGLYMVPAVNAKKLIEGNLHTSLKPLNVNLLFSADERINSYITAFYEDSDGRLWIGAWGSLYVLEEKNEELVNNNSDVTDRFKVTNVYNDNNKYKQNFPIYPAMSIIEVSRGKYWIGSLGGGIIEITEISKNNFKGAVLKTNPELPSNFIHYLSSGRNNIVWIGTNQGLCCVNTENSKLNTISLRDGLASDNINNIVIDKKGNAWVSTSYGISKIELNSFSVQNYFNSEKDSYNQFIINAGLCDKNKNIWFATSDALVKFNPDSVRNDTHRSPIFFTDIKIDNKTVVPLEKYFGTIILDASVNQCQTIRVPYNHSLSIEFASLNFTNPGRLLYKYKIEPNTEWILLNANQRSLVLPMFKHGQYALMVKLADDISDKNIRSIKINFLPPFWLSVWAYFLYVAVLLILLFIYRRLLIQKILQKSIIDKERFERKKMEELDKMKTEFFSNISHELRTPLSLIIDPLEKLQTDADITEKNRERLKLVLKSSNRLLKLTNELMDFSKIEQNLLVPDFQYTEITTLVNSICQLFYNVADSLNFDFKINTSFESLEIPIDKGMIEKVLFNLLSNAFKYTQSNGMIMVDINHAKHNNIDFVKLSVINTGEGIKHENVPFIFDRFYQVNNMQGRNVEGTGLGLAIVKSIIELHNGKIEVKSELGVETCFDVYLPLNQQGIVFSENSIRNEINTDEPAFQNLTSVEKGEINSNYRILLVEDEDDVRNYIADDLCAEYKIISAKNGKEGLEIANKVIPDLIITDVMMPVLSGLELCKTLRSQVITSHIPILILSAKSTTINQIEGLEMGADVYMVKPFSLEHLKAQIARLLSLKQGLYNQYKNEYKLIPDGSIHNKLDQEFMQKVMGYIEDNLSNSDLSVEQIAGCVALSKVQTYRKIKAITGLSIVEFIREVRLKKAAQMIREGRYNFSEIGFETGFSSPSYFSKCFHDFFGKSPSEYASQ